MTSNAALEIEPPCAQCGHCRFGQFLSGKWSVEDGRLVFRADPDPLPGRGPDLRSCYESSEGVDFDRITVIESGWTRRDLSDEEAAELMTGGPPMSDEHPNPDAAWLAHLDLPPAEPVQVTAESRTWKSGYLTGWHDARSLDPLPLAGLVRENARAAAIEAVDALPGYFEEHSSAEFADAVLQAVVPILVSALSQVREGGVERSAAPPCSLEPSPRGDIMRSRS